MMPSVKITAPTHPRTARWIEDAVGRLPGCRVHWTQHNRCELTPAPNAGATPGAGDRRTCGSIAIELDGEPGDTPFHSAWRGHVPAEAAAWEVQDPATNAMLHVLSVLPPIERAHGFVIRPAADPAFAVHGPIDALVLDRDAANMPGWWPLSAPVTIQSLTAQHTRCWLVGLVVDLDVPRSTEQLVESLQAAPNTLVLPDGCGFESTADLSEFFRDLGRPDLFFGEPVIFPTQLQCHGRRFQCWLAAHEMNRVSEAVTCAAHALYTDTPEARVHRRVAKAMDLVERVMA